MPLLSEARWYLYRSAPKIEMLYEQMFGADKTTKKAVSVNSPYGGVSAESSDDGKVSIEQKLKKVEQQLRETGRIGTLKEPGEFFEGLMPMRWGLFDDCEERPKDEPALVYFGGFDESEDPPLIVGLGGSTANVVGMNGASNTYSRSNTRVITRWLVSGLRQDAPPELPGWWDMDGEYSDLVGAAGIALHYLKPPTQNLQFVARTLFEGTGSAIKHFVGVERARVIIGTPLWVTELSPINEPNRYGLDEEWKTHKKHEE